MDIKSLTVIRTAIRSARDIIGEIVCEDYPHTPFEDKDLSDMFFQLNRMGIALTEKIKSMESRGQTKNTGGNGNVCTERKYNSPF